MVHTPCISGPNHVILWVLSFVHISVSLPSYSHWIILHAFFQQSGLIISDLWHECSFSDKGSTVQSQLHEEKKISFFFYFCIKEFLYITGKFLKLEAGFHQHRLFQISITVLSCYQSVNIFVSTLKLLFCYAYFNTHFQQFKTFCRPLEGCT
jgi:hypothetical protein